MRTLRQQLRLVLTGAILVFSVAGTVALYERAREEAGEQSDLLLRQVAASLPPRLAAGTRVPAIDDEEDQLVVQTFNRAGQLTYASAHGGAFALAPRSGFSRIERTGGAWRQYQDIQPDRIVLVAQPLAVRRRMALELVVQMLVPFVALLLVLAVFLYVAVGRILKPLDHLATAVSGRSPTRLEPLALDDVTPDLAPIVTAINTLLEKTQVALHSQQEFIANAAHELRSPLTALQLQLQLAERATSEDARADAFRKLEARLVRSSRLVHQLLALARSEPTADFEMGPVDLAQLARQAVADYSGLADDRQIDLGVSDDTCSVVVNGDADALAVLVNNLVDNAVRYSRSGDRIDVAMMQSPVSGWLSVRDTGPGVAETEWPRLFDRFYRVAGQGPLGCGLGLSIAHNIALRHDAQISVGPGPDGIGFRATVRFPLS